MARRRVTFILGANYQNFKKGLNSASKEFRKFGRNMERIGSRMSTRVTAPILAIGAAAFRAFGQQEQAERTLRASLQANGRQVDMLMSRYQQFASQMQRLTIVGDETTLAMLQQAESMGLTGDAAERAVRNSIAMQSAFGVSAERALRYTAALEQGEATMLRRYLPALRGIEDESKLAAEAQRILTDAFEVSKAEAEGATGQTRQMVNAIGDLTEHVGEVVSQAMLPYINRLKNLAIQLQTVNPAIIQQGVAIAAISAAVGPAVLLIGKLAKVVAALFSPLALKIGLLAAAAGAVWYLYENSDAAWDLISEVYRVRIKSIVAQINLYLRAIQELANLVGNTQLSLGLTGPIAALGEALENIELGGARTEFQTLSEFIDTAMGRVGQAVEFLKNKMFDFNTTNDQTITRGNVLADTFMNGVVPSLDIAGMRAQETGYKFEFLEGRMHETSRMALYLDDVANTFTHSFGQGMDNIVVHGERVVDVLQNIGKLLASAAIQRGLSLLLGSASGGTGLLGSMFGGFFADGGKLMPGQWGIVGEEGPEQIMATPSGAVITPNKAMSTGSSGARSGGGRQRAVININMDSRMVKRIMTDLDYRRG